MQWPAGGIKAKPAAATPGFSRAAIISLRHFRSPACMDDKERVRTLELTLGQIEKQFGKGSILRLGSKDAIVPVSAISSGSISVDYALGVGGFPRGRICEIFGPESSGKTTIALQVVAEAQRN